MESEGRPAPSEDDARAYRLLEHKVDLGIGHVGRKQADRAEAAFGDNVDVIVRADFVVLQLHQRPEIDSEIADAGAVDLTDGLPEIQAIFVAGEPITGRARRAAEGS